MPADDNLRRRFAIFISQLMDNFLIEDALTALGQRAPGFGLDLVGGVPGVQLPLLQQRMQLYLVDHRRDAGFINQLLQMRHLEITHADALRQPLLLQLNQRLPGLDVMADSRHRPVD